MNKKSKTQQVNTQVCWNNLFLAEHGSISKKISQLRKIIRKWDYFHESEELIPKTDEETIITYLQKISVFTSRSRFQKFRQNKNIHDQMIKQLDDLDDAYIHFKLFEQAKWRLIISEDNIDELIKLVKGQQHLKIFLTKLSLFSQGYIPINNNVHTNVEYLTELNQSAQKSYKCYFFNIGKIFIIVTIGNEKIPKLQFNKTTVNFMTYSPFIQIMKVFSKEPGSKEIRDAVEKIHALNQKNPSKNLSEDILEENAQDMEKLGKKIQFFKFERQREQFQNYITKKQPVIYKNKKCGEQQYQEYLFELKSYAEFKQNFRKKETYKKEQNQQKKLLKMTQYANLKQFFTFGSSKQLINVYDQIPNKLFKLTSDEKNIVTFDNNMIVIGRSGTGKTLCALLRLFVIQFFFKARQSLRACKQKRSLTAADIQRSIGLKNIFLTASPYLIKQIKKQYDEMIVHIKSILMEKDEKRKQQKFNNGQTVNQDDLSFNKNIFKDDEENPALDSLVEQFQQKIQRMQSLNDLNEKDFPGFFSIKKFIMMMDGTLKNPMLQKKNSYPQMEVQTQIKPLKNRMTEGQQQLQQNMIQNSKDFDQQQNIGWIEDQIQVQKVSEVLNKNVNKQTQLIEVDYEVFSKQFWPQVQKSYFKIQKQLTPSNIWSQIYSVIKGSYSSNQSHAKYLSKTQYLKVTKKEIDEELQYKKIVYQIFEYYENWKHNTDHYDFMDLVNHILSDIQIYGYDGPILNYLFVDQVQDLPPATLYLISKIVTNGVFYCGDSAQTIAKGVNFKFRDIPQMFSDQFLLEKIQMPSPKGLQLTVNFRSHNEILQLGHSIIMIIEKLFVGSIDKLKSQSSSFRGPVPILLTQYDQLKLLNILTTQLKEVSNLDPEYIKQYQRNISNGKMFRLGPQQIILVRNQQQKRNLPYRLRQGVVLTFEDVKGLQYDDVVLVNFFMSSRYKDKWRLLNCLDVQIQLIKKEVYQTERKSKQDLSGHHLEGDKNIFKKHDWNRTPNLVQKEDGCYYEVPIITYCKDIKGQNIKQFYELLTELKILYTAITRARKTFIIYEDSIPQNLQRLWLKMKAIRIIDGKNYESIKEQVHEYRRIHKNKSYQNQQKAWIKEGFKWYMRKNFQQAIRCFKNIGDMKTAKRIQAQMKANQAAVELRRIRYQLKNPNNIPTQQFKIIKKMLQAKMKPINNIFLEAAQLFELVNRIRNAGQCYYSGENYGKALECFLKTKFIKGIAECSQILRLFEQAADNYEILEKYEKMLACLEKGKHYKKVFEKMIQYLGQFTQTQSMCIKYGQMFLHYSVKNYLSSNKNMKIACQNVNSAIYSTPSIFSIKKNSSRFILFECLKNLENIVQARVRLERNQENRKHLQSQIQEIQNQQKILAQQFQIKPPFKKLQEGSQFYILRQKVINYKKTKPFSQACFNYDISEKDAIQLAQNFGNIRQIVSNLKQKKQELEVNIKKLNNQYAQIMGKYGSRKDIQRNIQILRLQYEKNKFQEYQKDRQIHVKKININPNFQIQIKKFQNQIKNNFLKLVQNKDIQKQSQISFLDHSFNSECWIHQSRDNSFSMSMLDAMTDTTNGVILNFCINRQAVGQLILKSKDLIKKMKNYLDYPLKPPFSDQHHLLIDSKIQSAIIKQTKKQQIKQAQQIITFLRKLQRIGEDQLAIFTCEFYQLYDLAKKFIISRIVKTNQMFKKSKVLTKIPYLEKKRKHISKDQINQCLNTLNPNYLQSECFRTLSTKQPIINSIVESLLIQGFYRNSIQYMNNNKSNKIQVAFAFMDYEILYQNIKQLIPKMKIFDSKEKYLFLSQTIQDYKVYAKMINSFSIQQIFYLYDSIQQRPFFSQINWNEGVNISNETINFILIQVKKVMRNAQQELKNLKAQIKNKTKQIFQTLNKKHQQQLKKQNIIVSQLYIKKNQTLKQKQSLSKLCKELNYGIQKLVKQNKKIQNQMKLKNKQILAIQQTLHILRGTRKLLKSLEVGLQIQCRSYFYQIDAFEVFKFNSQYFPNNYKKIIIPQIKIDYGLDNRVAIFEHQKKIIQQKIKQFKQQIYQNEDQINQIKSSQQNYIKENNAKSNQIINEQIQKAINMSRTHKKQRQNQQKLLKDLKDQLQLKQNIFNTLQKETSNTQFKKEQFKIIKQIKQQYRQKIKSKLKNCSQLPSQYQNGYFSYFLKYGLENLKELKTISFKKELKVVIQNSKNNFNNLSTFHQCEIIVLYLCVIFYPEKNEMFEYLKRQSNSQQQYQRQKIRQQIHQTRNKIKNIQNMKNNYQNGYFSPQQQREILIYKKDIQNLQYDFKNVGKGSSQTFKTTYNKLKEMFIDIYERTNSLQSESDFHFIELMMGFFQCRLIRKCQPLWFLDSQYVIAKSNSIIVKTVLNHVPQKRLNIFCYYFDDNKQFVIMKFQNVFKTMKSLLRNKHMEFLKKMQFKDQLRQCEKRKYYQFKNIKDFENKKSDQKGFILQQQCNPNQKQEIKNNYNIFTNKLIQLDISSHKEQILRYYYENGFKTAETFHFLQYQLKVLDETSRILQVSEQFSSLMINDSKLKLKNLKEQFDKWKSFIKKQKQITKCSCQDEEMEVKQYK